MQTFREKSVEKKKDYPYFELRILKSAILFHFHSQQCLKWKEKNTWKSQRQKKEDTLKKWLGKAITLLLALTKWAIFYPGYLLANTHLQRIFSTDRSSDTEQQALLPEDVENLIFI